MSVEWYNYRMQSNKCCVRYIADKLVQTQPLTRNWELAQHGFVCPSVQFPFAPFQ